eukprot:11945191-Ditylum_brightwellii.AAC.1
MSFSTTSNKEDVSSTLAQEIIEKISTNPTKLCLAIAGSGSSALSSLTSTPGASSLLLEGILAYDRHSYAHFVARHPPPTFLPQEKESKGYGYASLKSSVVLANAALHQA